MRIGKCLKWWMCKEKLKNKYGRGFLCDDEIRDGRIMERSKEEAVWLEIWKGKMILAEAL